jgi:hypothetical protein
MVPAALVLAPVVEILVRLHATAPKGAARGRQQDFGHARSHDTTNPVKVSVLVVVVITRRIARKL